MILIVVKNDVYCQQEGVVLPSEGQNLHKNYKYIELWPATENKISIGSLDFPISIWGWDIF